MTNFRKIKLIILYLVEACRLLSFQFVSKGTFTWVYGRIGSFQLDFSPVSSKATARRYNSGKGTAVKVDLLVSYLSHFRLDFDKSKSKNPSLTRNLVHAVVCALLAARVAYCRVCVECSCLIVCGFDGRL